MSVTQDEMPQRAVVQFNCTGQAVGKMRNDLDVSIVNLKVNVRVQWDWEAKDRVYETAPRSFEIDVFLDSKDALDVQLSLIQAAMRSRSYAHH